MPASISKVHESACYIPVSTNKGHGLSCCIAGFINYDDNSKNNDACSKSNGMHLAYAALRQQNKTLHPACAGQNQQTRPMNQANACLHPQTKPMNPLVTVLHQQTKAMNRLVTG
jgi:hypothetical protein